jgi:RNA polymerase sigma factor (sigma-70 family)
MSAWLSDALLRTQADDRLVALTREGHERAFAAIVERYRRPLIAYARRGVPDGGAEDVVQQALVSAWAGLAAGAEVQHLRGWLYQIVRHETVRVAQREGRALEDPLAFAAAADVESEVAQREQVRDVLAGIAELPDAQREAFVQTAVAGRSRSEVATSLGLSEGAVRQLVHRARSTLRTAITAITPLPLATWAAGTGGGPGIAELAAGAGTATIGATLLKAGTVVVATGAVAGGVKVADRPPERAATRPAVTQPATVPTTDRSGSNSGSDDRSGRESGEDRSGSDDNSGHGSASSGSSGSDDHSGSGHGSDD